MDVPSRVDAAGAANLERRIHCQAKRRALRSLPLARRSCLALYAISLLAALSACGTENGVVIEVRVRNVSKLDFTGVSVAGQPYGDVPAGETGAYKEVRLRFGYAALEFKAGGRRVIGQTLNLGAARFTYAIDVVDLEAGHLAIEVIAE